jgi:uncharacterized protein YcaQ
MRRSGPEINDTTMTASTMISAKEARRIALAAQGLAAARPTGRLDRRHLQAVLARTGLFQMDSVNVLARAHYLPLFSRLGAYPVSLLEEAAWGRRRLLFEYWGHEASLLPLDLHPLLRWRMARAATGNGMWRNVAQFARENRAYIDGVLDEVAARGPLAAGELEGRPRGKSAWWGWSEAKRALEYLFWTGQLTASSRRASFERVYDVPERVIPAPILAQPTPTEPAAQRELVRIAAKALGIATERDLRDYFRLDLADCRTRIAELVEEGALTPATVEGWKQPAYLAPGATAPRRGIARTLLSPFDPLVWERQRTARLFGFRYRIEIYTPAHKREHGYYVLPFLMGEGLVARVDLKSDRAAGRLRVLSAHLEAGADPDATAEALGDELRLMAQWLSLDGVSVARRGDLAAALSAALR